MRLLCVLQDQEKVKNISAFLTNENIEYQLDVNTNTDWGSPDYGLVDYNLWIVQEDQFDKANDWLNDFNENPHDVRFKQTKKVVPIIDFIPLDEEIKPKEEADPLTKWDKLPVGKITYYLFILCTVILGFTTFTAPTAPTTDGLKESAVPFTVVMSPLEKIMLYDYPDFYVLLDRFVNVYGVAALQYPESLSTDGKVLYNKISTTPYWQGIYGKVVEQITHPSSNALTMKEPLFEKIRQGEFWRLFTPCLLHSDIFHLFFNMIWLLVLGKQMEQRIPRSRYLIFIIATAIFSNTAQYLMGGSTFLGFSGVLCAMLGFIWTRKKYAAWEGYQLQDSTIHFMAFFVLFMFSIQFVSFILEINSQAPLASNIANTAHITGGMIGIFLGRFNYFSWKV